MTPGPLRVAVLHGGPSREHGVSLDSGLAVVAALSEAGLVGLPVRIEADGRWTLPAPPGAGSAGADSPDRPPDRPADAMARLATPSRPDAVDVVFVALHGAYGEDGTVQGLLETAGVPYTGSGVAASALAMDKERTKEVLSHHGVVTPPWVGVTAREWAAHRSDVLARTVEELGAVVVVKPVCEGSSFGITMVDDATALAAALENALDGPGRRALVEARVEGVEVTCPVLGNSDGELETLPLVEIVPHGRVFFDFAAKYEGESDEICPARIDEAAARRVREASLRAHRVLGCDGLSRSDFVIDASGTPWFLEINTVPGMTPASLCPLAATAAGLSFPQLCARLVELALARR